MVLTDRKGRRYVTTDQYGEGILSVEDEEHIYLEVVV
jgi:hypothetical protein